MLPISVLFLTASFTVLVSARRALPTHSSRRLLTVKRWKSEEEQEDHANVDAVGEGVGRAAAGVT